MSDLLNTLMTSMQNHLKVTDNFNYNFKSALARNSAPFDHQQFQEIFQKFSHFQEVFQEVTAGGKSTSGLSGITNGISQINEQISILSKSVEEVKDLYSDILRDAQPGELVQILKVKKVKKINEENEEIENWFIEVRSDSKCVKNFRNVEIWDISNGNLITSFKLIEPKVIIKRKIDAELLPMTYFVAKIEGKIVSKPYLIPHLNITVKNINSQASVEVENLFNENVEDLYLIYNDLEPKEIELLEGGASHSVKFDLAEGNKITAYVLQQTKVISNTFNDFPTIDPIIPEVGENPSAVPIESFENLSIENKAMRIYSNYPNADFNRIMEYVQYYHNCSEQVVVEYLRSQFILG